MRYSDAAPNIAAACVSSRMSDNVNGVASISRFCSHGSRSNAAQSHQNSSQVIC
ncbi:hypothetical protein GS891_11885 [Rhodococcus hoagii]|nr:hypothetical protein [Prescottella equi]